MRNALIIITICMACTILQSCGQKKATNDSGSQASSVTNTTASTGKGKPFAHGEAGKILVVMSDSDWKSVAGDSVRAVFYEECPNMPYDQSYMDLVHVPYEKFVDKNMLNRNIIFYERIAAQKEGELKIEKNKYAIDQTFVRITAANQKDFAKALCDKRKFIINYFISADRERYINSYKYYRNGTGENKIAQHFNISISLPSKYHVDEILNNFSWISYENTKTIYGIFVYDYPLTDSTTLSVDQIVARRNEILEKCVPGGPEGSYMTTETKYDYPSIDTLTHRGTNTAVVHGMWKMHGDFMGGPFVSYTKIDEARQRVVCVEGFVFEPNSPVRDKIREVESIISTYSINPL